MKTFEISSKTSGATLGQYEATDRDGALDALARDAGYADHAAACVASGDDGAHLIVTEVELSQPSPEAYSEAMRDAALSDHESRFEID